VLQTYNAIIDFSGTEKVPYSEESTLRHLSNTQMKRGPNSGDTSYQVKFQVLMHQELLKKLLSSHMPSALSPLLGSYQGTPISEEQEHVDGHLSNDQPELMV